MSRSGDAMIDEMNQCGGEDQVEVAYSPDGRMFNFVTKAEDSSVAEKAALTSRQMWPAIAGLFGLDGRSVAKVCIHADLGDAVRIRSTGAVKQPAEEWPDAMSEVIYEAAANVRRMVIATSATATDAKRAMRIAVDARSKELKASHILQLDRLMDRHEESVREQSELRKKLPAIIRWWYGIR